MEATKNPTPSSATFVKRNALVTGSTSGIGFGIAQSLARAGFGITLNGFGNLTEIQTLRAQLEKECAVRVTFSNADMSRPESIREMIAESQADHGSLDILVNNAGIQHVAPVDAFPDEKWDAILAINLSSNFHAIKAALPLMKKNGWGRIINIASVHGLVASPFKSAYVAAKHGVLGLTKATALELAETEITCNAICPGYVRTPLVENQIDQQAAVHKMTREQVIRDVILGSQPKKSFVEVDDLGELVKFLCSPAGRSITGSSLTVDGGWTAR